MSGIATPDMAGAGGDDSLDEDMAAFFGRKESGVMKERVVKGMNLWDKKQVTISGERIAKVDRVASQVAQLIVDLRAGSVPVHNAVALTEYLSYLRNLCDLADVYISSKPIGCGLKFRVRLIQPECRAPRLAFPPRLASPSPRLVCQRLPFPSSRLCLHSLALPRQRDS